MAPSPGTRRHPGQRAETEAAAGVAGDSAAQLTALVGQVVERHVVLVRAPGESDPTQRVVVLEGRGGASRAAADACDGAVHRSDSGFRHVLGALLETVRVHV